MISRMSVRHGRPSAHFSVNLSQGTVPFWPSSRASLRYAVYWKVIPVQEGSHLRLVSNAIV
jgi:hypothetical protein